MPRLTDFHPVWIDLGDRKGLGFIYRCTTGHCTGLNTVLFANPLDGGPPCPMGTWELRDALIAAGLIDDDGDLKRLHRGCGKTRWNRDPLTSTFENLTLSPSINACECGHFTVVNGGW